MVSNAVSAVENNFTKGLVTEFTGLNFPENAATDTDNCIYTLVGDVTRREGIDFEVNGTTQIYGRTNAAVSSYKWNNAGGNGETQIVVSQVGSLLLFYKSSSSTVSNPLSTTFFSSLDLTAQVATGATFDITQECQFSDGNGYLFVYHPNCDPFYVTFDGSVTVTATAINLQVRDTQGVFESIPVNLRPTTLSAEHNYNIRNQGWTAGSPWAASSSTTTAVPFSIGSHSFTVASGISGVTIGQVVAVQGRFAGFPFYVNASGTVTGYSGATLTVSISQVDQYLGEQRTCNIWSIFPTNTGYINTWLTAEGNYPSNADVWWYFKNTGDVFDPGSTQPNVTLSVGNAPQGHFLLNAFSQNRSVASGVSGLTSVSTTARPTTGTFFQGRVWYTGVNASQQATGDAQFYTWSENIYFSQVCLSNATNFGNCFQVNDPTSENLFGILPSDGGVIQIPGSGNIYKLFPLQNALIVFAANGVWYITGSQGIGFSANDYTIVKLSSVQSISNTSFVDVHGLPYFWNEEGIYAVEPAKQGTSLLNNPLHVNPLEVNPITVGTILTYYNNIPSVSKKYAKGVYDPVNYVIQWLFKSTVETSVTDRYTYDSVLNFNNYNKAFYPYTVDTTLGSINSILYVNYPNEATSPDPTIKYFCSNPASHIGFADEHSTTYVDWSSLGGMNFDSYFVTGYKLHGQGQKRFQLPYIYVYSKAQTATAYVIQSIWDYATSGRSGKYSSAQTVYNNKPYFGMIFRRHRLRGQGIVLQIKITSVDGQPFDIMGWSTFENLNQGV